jgi:HK97 family phage major capsid protein
MVASIEEVSKQVRELDDLVRGATQNSQRAVADLQAALAGQDARLKAAEQLRADLDALAKGVLELNRRVLTRVISPGGNYRGAFDSREDARTFGLAILGLVGGNAEARGILEHEGTLPMFRKAMAAGTDVLGGFLVPEQFEPTILRLVEQYGAFRRNAFPVPISGDRDVWPVRTGGLTVYCPGEGVAITASDVAVGQVALTLKEWFTLTAISGKLLISSAVSVAELVIQEIALAFAIKEDTCGFTGDGTSSYFGVVGVLVHASTSNQAGASGDTTFLKCAAWKYLAGAVGQVPDWALPTSKYYFSRTVFWTDVVGQVDSNGRPIVQFAAGMGQGVPPIQLTGMVPMILGHPVEISPALPALSADAISTAYWCFGSLYRGWMIGQRAAGAYEIAQSREVYFATDQIGIRGKCSVDIVAADATAVCKTTTAAA